MKSIQWAGVDDRIETTWGDVNLANGESCPPNPTKGGNSANFSGEYTRNSSSWDLLHSRAFGFLKRWEKSSPHPVWKVPAILACLLLNEALVGIVELCESEPVKDRNKDRQKAALGAACANATNEMVETYERHDEADEVEECENEHVRVLALKSCQSSSFSCVMAELPFWRAACP